MTTHSACMQGAETVGGCKEGKPDRTAQLPVREVPLGGPKMPLHRLTATVGRKCFGLSSCSWMLVAAATLRLRPGLLHVNWCTVLPVL